MTGAVDGERDGGGEGDRRRRGATDDELRCSTVDVAASFGDGQVDSGGPIGFGDGGGCGVADGVVGVMPIDETEEEIKPEILLNIFIVPGVVANVNK